MGTPSKTAFGHDLKPDTNEQLNQILFNSFILKTPNTYNSHEWNIVFSWIINKEKYGSWLAEFGLQRKILFEGFNAKDTTNFERNKLDALLVPFKKTGEFEISNKPRLLKENTHLIKALNDAVLLFRKRVDAGGSRTPGSRASMQKDIDTEIKKIADLYAYTHHWYEQLYAIIRQELKDTTQELIKSHPGNVQFTQKIINYSLTIPNETSLFPKILPLQLPPLNDPSKKITIKTLDDQLEQARAQQHVEQTKKAQEESTQKKIPSIKVKESPDGSYINQEDETAEHIIIHNPKNKTTEVIFKTDKPFLIGKQLPPIGYTDWVKMWFENPAKALEAQGYLDEKSKKFTAEHLRWKPIAMHAFSPLIDEYIMQWGREGSLESRRAKGKKDILVTIPGMMIYPDNTKETGVFAYIIDSSNGQWYHRMFTPESGQRLIADLFEKGYFSPEMTGYYEVFFPALPSKK